MQGHGKRGLSQISQGLVAWQSTQAKLAEPYILALLAEVHEKTGSIEEGLIVLEKALRLIDQIEERHYEAELYRLKGKLILNHTTPDIYEAEICFQKAIAVSQSQQAKSWELRAATSLGRLWQSQDKCLEAYELLAPVYSWFTEGFYTADLQDAQILIEEFTQQR